ncbi:MAG: DUF1592 domain-containing protein, partial [Verrucomicrobia bacterium]|nr:DUF1592 domain-containing protein [Verrucomicrobiota bacterium]
RAACPRFPRQQHGQAARATLALATLVLGLAPLGAAPAFDATAFADQYCANCHDDVEKKGGFDITALTYQPDDPANFARWVKIHDRIQAGEMPPKEKKNRPGAAEQTKFLTDLATALVTSERGMIAREGRATQRRLNGYEYENALRDLLSAPWLQVRGQFPDDGEAFRFNKIGDALDVSHVHMARYINAADYAMRQAMGVQLEHPPTTTKRYYARDQRTLTSKFTGSIFNSSPDRMTYPVVGLNTAQPDVRWLRTPLTDPKTRDEEAVAWVSSNYVTGFTYRWDGFRAPTAGRYRVRFSGYTLWVPPGGISMRFKGEKDKVGTPSAPNKNHGDYDHPQPGRTEEPITVYTRNGIMNRRVGSFDLTPTPATHDLGEVWLLANETLVPDASRFYRSRPNNFKNPLMTEQGTPSVAFRWMEVEGPLYDDASTAGYKLLFGDLPLVKAKAGAPGVTLAVVDRADKREGGRNAGQRTQSLDEVTVEVVSKDPTKDADRLMRGFLARAYRRPVAEADVKRFLALVEERRAAGLSFAESMLAGYTAVLASPGFVFLDEKPGKLDDTALATRLALFLWNSPPDAALRDRAARGELSKPGVLRAETERLLSDAKAQRFQEAFLDYWIDLRKMEDSTPSTTLYNDYYLDDALAEAAQLETQLTFDELIRKDLPARSIVDADFTYLNERLANHYGIPGVKGVAMRRVTLPPDSPRGGFMTQASVLKITANGTTTSPVLRGKWIVERILGIDIPPPPPVAAVEPDIRGAVTIRQQLAKHREDPSCASCHSKMDPPGFALESFDVMGAWRDRYRGVDEKKPAEKGIGKNGHAYEYHFGLPVDAKGELPDGRPFQDIRDFKRLVREEDTMLARNLARQLLVFATGAPVRFSDRAAVEQILQRASAHRYGLRSLIHEVVESPLFLNK